MWKESLATRVTRHKCSLLRADTVIGFEAELVRFGITYIPYSCEMCSSSSHIFRIKFSGCCQQRKLSKSPAGICWAETGSRLLSAFLVAIAMKRRRSRWFTSIIIIRISGSSLCSDAIDDTCHFQVLNQCTPDDVQCIQLIKSRCC